MLTYNLINTGSDSLYIYLYKCIKNDIINGKLSNGEKLPSKRTFAKNLGISVITVENCYAQLIAEGYIYSIPKRGFYVCDLSGADVSNIYNNKENAKDSETKINSINSDKINLTGGKDAYIANFTSNQTDSDIFPFSSWTKSVRAVLNDSRIQLMTNPPCGGIMKLRCVISDYLKEFRAMNVKPEHIIIGAGTEYLYSLLIQLLGSGLCYGVENPGYHKIAKIYESMKVPYKYIDIDDDGIPAQLLEKNNIDIVHISPSHHFPTGIVMPVSRRYELLGWAAKRRERYIIEDDYDSELRLSGRPVPTLQSIDVSDKVIYINTFTKTLASTVRISYMVLPQSLADRFYEKLSFYSCTVSNFEQYTLAHFMESHGFEKHINRLRNYYQNKRDTIIRIFQKSRLGNIIEISKEEAGVHFLMKINTAKNEKEIVKLAASKGIKLLPLSAYFIGEESETVDNSDRNNIYVLNYSSVNLHCVEKVANILYNISVD